MNTTGQYEICGRILDVCEELGCRFVITLGGLKKETEADKPKLYFAAADKETVSKLLAMKAEIIRGQIFGAAGLLVGLGKLRSFRGFCLLAETLGLYPDGAATRKVLNLVCDMLNLQVNLDNLDDTVEVTSSLLENFGLLERAVKEKGERESQFRWFV